MSGLVDTDTGLAYGTSLIFQDAIGGAGLVISTSTPEWELEWGTGNLLLWDTLYLTWGLEPTAAAGTPIGLLLVLTNS